MKEGIPEPLWVVESPASRNTGGLVERETENGRAELRGKTVEKAIIKKNANLAAMVQSAGDLSICRYEKAT